MLGYLKGTVAGVQKNGNRVVLTLEVNSIGYQLQIPPRIVEGLPGSGEAFQVFTHLQVREDQLTLYGFASAAERDLFRELLGVSGIGAQLAIALLDTLGLSELVGAIVASNTKALAKAPGVGKKTAERISLELRTKLAQWHHDAGPWTTLTAGMAPSLQEDVEMTLLALGYTNSEVTEALQEIGADTSLAASAEPEEWIRRAIAWLSQG